LHHILSYPDHTHKKPQSHKWPLSLAEILKALVIVVLFASFTLPCSTVIFAVTRMLLPILYETPVLHLVLRPLSAHFLRGSWTIFLLFRHFPLLFRAWFLSFTTLAAWETSEVLFDAFVTQVRFFNNLTLSQTSYRFYSTACLSCLHDPGPSSYSHLRDNIPRCDVQILCVFRTQGIGNGPVCRCELPPHSSFRRSEVYAEFMEPPIEGSTDSSRARLSAVFEQRQGTTASPAAAAGSCDRSCSTYPINIYAAHKKTHLSIIKTVAYSHCH